MLAQAISSTTPVTPKSMASGVWAPLWSELCPRAPGLTVADFARNFSIVASLMPLCSGASTAFTTLWYRVLRAALARSSVMPGFRRAKR